MCKIRRNPCWERISWTIYDSRKKEAASAEELAA